jgi:hypothetical protein
MTDDERPELKDNIMQAGLTLKRRQAFWETPQGFAAVIAALAVTIGAIGAIGGVVGYQIGRAPETVTQQFILPPGTTIQIGPAPAPAK